MNIFIHTHTPLGLSSKFKLQEVIGPMMYGYEAVSLRIDSLVSAATPPCLRQWISDFFIFHPEFINAALE